MDLITVSGAARIIGCSADYVRHLERTGKLRALRTDSGIRLFDRSKIEQFVAERSENPPRRGRVAKFSNNRKDKIVQEDDK